MRSFCGRAAAALLIAAVGLLCATGSAQQMPGPPGSMNAALSKLFGNIPFTGKAEFRVLDSSMRETTIMPLTYSMLDGRTRLDVEVAEMKSVQMPAAAALFMKQLGTLTAIIRPDEKRTILVYPSLKAYTENPITGDDAADLLRNFKTDKTAMGRESVAGHDCEKDKVILTDDANHAEEALVWYATDLKNFPIRIQMSEPNQVFVVTFSKVKLGRPDAKLFEAPAGMTRYGETDMVKKLKAMADAGQP
jgi:hypothetical protein